MGVIEIPLGRGYAALIDEADLPVIRGYRWHATVQGRPPNLRVYATADAAAKTYLRMHRVIWERAYGPIPEGYEIDHKEPGQYGGLDNRRENLRLTTKSLNQANSRRGRNNTSGYKGVWWQKQARRWRADLWVSGRKYHLGYHDTAEAAAHAYDLAAKAAFGDYARLNFPQEAA